MKALVYSGIVQGFSTPAPLLLIMLLTGNRAVMGDNVKQHPEYPRLQPLPSSALVPDWLLRGSCDVKRRISAFSRSDDTCFANPSVEYGIGRARFAAVP